jgi:uncharacterized membrane protein YqjE
MPGAPLSGVKESLRELGADALALARVRVELLGVELKEALQLQKRMLVLAIVSSLFLAAGLMGLSVLVVVLFWDTHRMAAIGGVTAAYLGIGGWAFLRLRDLVQNGPMPFGATIAEFQRDLDILRGSE